VAEAADVQGTGPASVPRGWLRRAAAVLALLPLLMGALQAPPAAVDAHAAPQRNPDTGSRTAEVSITRLTPVTPDDDTLTVSGTITNNGSSTITGAEVGLRTGPRLSTRSAIDQAAARTGFSPLDGTEVTDENGNAKLAGIATGATRSFTLELPVKSLRFEEAGVYQLGVSLTGQTKNEAYRRVLGIERTFVPWQTSTVDTKTELAFVWPLISSSHLTARMESESDEQQIPVFRDDALAAEIAPGGRLQQLVALGKNLPVSWVVDPDLLASVDAMTRSYKVETGDGATLAGTEQDTAKEWLHDLQQATEGAEVVALPFGDPDLASLAHRGKNVTGSLSHLGPATETAVKTVETILHTTPNTDFAWPVEGAIDRSVVSVATSAGARKVITRSDSLKEDGLAYTPSAARPIGGGTTAVSADSRLSKLFLGDMTQADNSVLAVQQFLAHTRSINAQSPTKQRSIVVAPQRMPTASQAQTMATAIEALRDNDRWTEFTELSEAAKARPDPAANREVPTADAYPGKLRERELTTEAFEEIQQTQTTVDDFTVILSRDDRVVPPFGNAVRREMSASWRGRGEEAAAYRTGVQDYLTTLKGEVRLVRKSRMTLSGRSATIPVTVRNNLIQPVDGLELRLTSGRRIGLEIDSAQKPVVVEGGHSQSVKFDTTAKANGRTSVTAQLYTKDNKPYGEPMTFQVDVTEITSTVLLVIAGGVLLVVLAGIRMYTQRRRREPLPDPDAPLRAQAEDTTEDTADESDESDNTQDTGSESGDSSGSGEKVDH
jgi:Family of unknown function (DUF6049)